MAWNSFHKPYFSTFTVFKAKSFPHFEMTFVSGKNWGRRVPAFIPLYMDMQCPGRGHWRWFFLSYDLDAFVEKQSSQYFWQTIKLCEGRRIDSVASATAESWHPQTQSTANSTWATCFISNGLKCLLEPNGICKAVFQKVAWEKNISTESSVESKAWQQKHSP